MFPKDTTATSSERISEAKDHYPKCRFIPQLTVYGDSGIDDEEITKSKLVEKTMPKKIIDYQKVDFKSCQKKGMTT